MAGKSSRRWLQEHFSDPYVKKAQQEGYRSRAVYKLIEIQERDRLFRPGMVVVELGAAPGGWSQYIVKLIKPKGRILALDLLPMEPIEGVDFIQGDFSEESVVNGLLEIVPNADWVVSDMAPNTSGYESVDVPRSIYLAEMTLDFALKVLHLSGGVLIKVFQGEGFDALLAQIKKSFKKVTIRKPKASRDRSREVYILAKELKKT